MELLLPNRIDAGFLLPLLSFLDSADAATSIILDFKRLRKASPAALVALTARVTDWDTRGRNVTFRNLNKCHIAPYLNRMELLKNCGVDTGELFPYHDARGRYMPVRKVGVDVNEMGSEMALCVAPGGDEIESPLAGVYDLVWYVFTEMANNVRQHSGGLGYACAQVHGEDGFVKLAIADNGKGVRQSFVDAGFQWSQSLTDVGAIRKAMEPFISSKGTPTNEGVGLTLTAELARQAKAWLLIASGRGAVVLRPDGIFESEELPDGAKFPGTLVGMTFDQKSVPDFAAMLHNAKTELGLLQPKAAKGRFAQ